MTTNPLPVLPTLGTSFRIVPSLAATGPDAHAPVMVPYTFTLRFDPEADEIVAEYQGEGTRTRFTLRRVVHRAPPPLP